jgi:retron-type reverse transcriptase
LRPKRSCSFDEINTCLLHKIIDVISLPLTFIFNLSFSTGVFPDKLKIAKIIPIHKSGSFDDLINFRPISILPALSKILERLMYNRMIKFLNKFNVLHAAQYGFRSGRSTESALIDLNEYVSKYLDQSMHVFALYLDVAKAFDSINHSVLLNKLAHYGFRDKANAWFHSYLSNRFQYVSIANNSSNLRLITHGVPQGSILGPLLFLLYINDLPLTDKNAHFVLFADDTSALIPVNPNIDNTVILNDICSNIFLWFFNNRLIINCLKTKCMYFSISNVDNLPVINVGNTVLQYVNDFKLLGCYVSHNMKWNAHIDHVLSRVSKGIAMLCCVRNFFPKHIKRMIYFAFVNSHLLYCISLWGNAPAYLLNKLIVMQKKAIRLICNVQFDTHVQPLARDLCILLLPDLYVFRCAINMYMCVHNLNVLSSYDCFKRVNTTHNTVRSSYLLSRPYARTTMRLKSVSISSICIWNNLSPNIVSSLSLNMFKCSLKTFLIGQYI